MDPSIAKTTPLSRQRRDLRAQPGVDLVLALLVMQHGAGSIKVPIDSIDLFHLTILHVVVYNRIAS